MHRKIIAGLIILILAASCFVAFSYLNVSAAKNHKINGWAWSENIGWVSLNCYNQGISNKCANSDYGIDYDKNSGEISGWGYSENGGWLCFGSACEDAGLAKSPDNEKPSAKINENGMISGWANWTVLNENGWLKLRGERKEISGSKADCKNCARLKDDSAETCGFCFAREDFGGSAEICSACGNCENNVCESCADCYSFGVAVDFAKNVLLGWGWNGDADNTGFGWLKFHPEQDKSKINPPYLQTIGGDIYSAEGIGSLYQPTAPAGKYNATYLLQSNGAIVHFSSECEETGDCEPSSGWIDENADAFEIPRQENQYYGSLGSIDLKGIFAGQYGKVKNINNQAEIDSVLNRNIYFSDHDLEVSDKVFQNGNGESSGAGTIIVRGDLRITGNVSYSPAQFQKIKNLASVGWLVLKNEDGTGGNVYIDPEVERFVGFVFAENTFYTGTNSNNDKQLFVSGALAARKFEFQRNFMDLSREEPAELIIYDGRALANSPAGFADIGKALPIWE
ncbi:hypothetical protein KKC32_04955 [Patescibacteria group bacterium]|nr:hypothetical protein [Patescibacteria group bacterium]